MDFPLPIKSPSAKKDGPGKPVASKKAQEDESNHLLGQAFESSLQANLLYTVSHGAILKANRAACRLLGYSKKELLTKNTKDIFDVGESHFKKLHNKGRPKGEYKGVLTVFKKNGKRLTCEITSATFLGDHNIKKAIITLEDMSEGILREAAFEKEIQEKVDLDIRLKENEIAEAIIDAKELERSDIGKELHDNVNQLLGASQLYLNMAKKDEPDREMYLSRSSEYMLAAIEEIRKLTKGLTADTIKNFGLEEAIGNICKDTMEVNPIKLSCKVNPLIEDRVNDKFKLAVFRIVQEQLSNILKHARAKSARIRLSQIRNNILLVISDDGIGFDTGKKRNGIGMTNIQSRTAFYKGVAHFSSSPGNGCLLTVNFPVTAAVLNPEVASGPN